MAEQNTGAPKRPDTEKMQFGETHSYFSNNVLPHSIQANKRKIAAPTAYIHNHDLSCLLITGGTGKLSVNGRDYILRPNILVTLGPFHVYRCTPDKGQTLEITEARINSGTYMYLIANPYFKLPEFSVPSEPPVLHLHGLAKDIAYQAMEGLLAECGGERQDGYSLCFCYMTDLFGLLVDARDVKRYQARRKAGGKRAALK